VTVYPRKERSLDLCLDRSPSELDIFLCDLLLVFDPESNGSYWVDVLKK
jgi:hypothetical protein